MARLWLKKQLNALELYTVDVIYGRRAGAGSVVYGGFLQGLSWVFNGITQARLWLYRHRIFHDQPLGCLVVVVGNLTVGGTGKTPVVEKFARALRDRGRRVAILSRGYKSKAVPLWKKGWYWLTHAEEPPPRIVSDGREVLLDSEQAGDEPYMLARNLPGVIVLVDKNRVKAGEYAIKRFGCDTLVLDDGFQYLPLKGSLNLLLVDKTNPFGNGHLLPRGVLREPVKHLRRASYVFLTKSNGQRDPELERTIAEHNPGVDIIECAHRPQYLRRLGVAEGGAESRVPLTFLKGRRVLAFSGIATPESFEKFLRDLGALLVARERFLDHYRFGDEDLEELFALARREGAECLVTTEKDAVRINEQMACPLPLYYLRLEIDILRGAADFDEAVARICFPTRGGR
ncbi:MAG: tetraacyldisaccharide 4'-kinase [Verrucomicrobia bacterium]|nr:tetraacyldisaccharide 4'-kinase [Verrucomicrobiota bacterium]